MNVLKVKVAGQRYRYEVMRVEFDKDCNLLKDSSELKQGGNRNFLRFNDNRLDISNYKEFDHIEAGVAIYCRKKEIHFEFGKLSGKIPMKNVLSALNHPILLAHRHATEEEGLRLTTATIYDEENTIYEYTLEVSDNDFNPSLLEVIIILDPIMEEDLHIVEMRYDGKKMKGGLDGLPFGDPMEDKSMYILSVPQEYADALGLGENKKLDNILRFDDFIKEEYQKEGKKVKSAKGYVKLREDYIHSFIDEHEPDHDLPEEE